MMNFSKKNKKSDENLIGRNSSMCKVYEFTFFLVVA